MSDNIEEDFSDKAILYKKLQKAKKKNQILNVYKLKISKRMEKININAHRIHLSTSGCFDIPDLGIENFIPDYYEQWESSYLLICNDNPDTAIAISFNQEIVNLFDR